MTADEIVCRCPACWSANMVAPFTIGHPPWRCVVATCSVCGKDWFRFGFAKGEGWRTSGIKWVGLVLAQPPTNKAEAEEFLKHMSLPSIYYCAASELALEIRETPDPEELTKALHRDVEDQLDELGKEDN